MRFYTVEINRIVDNASKGWTLDTAKINDVMLTARLTPESLPENPTAKLKLKLKPKADSQ